MKKRVRSILVLALPYILPVLLPLISIFCLGSMVVFNYHERIISDKQKSIESAFERFLHNSHKDDGKDAATVNYSDGNRENFQ